jgi:hydroxymethylglutaryl-CoA lyase
MADTDEIFKKIQLKKLHLGKARAWSLVPNRKGLDRALKAGARQIAVFTAASETFNRRNIGMSIEQSLKECAVLIREAKRHHLEIRGYVSTAFWCPFEGKIQPKKSIRVIESLAKLGVFQVSIGDTIGAATPKEVEAVFKPMIRVLGAKSLAAHFHDTRGTALANALRVLELGIRTLDSSAGGLGGCPFAPGASGNLATEDLVYMLQGMGIHTGIDLDRLCKVSLKLAKEMKRQIASRYLQAFASSC